MFKVFAAGKSILSTADEPQLSNFKGVTFNSYQEFEDACAGLGFVKPSCNVADESAQPAQGEGGTAAGADDSANAIGGPTGNAAQPKSLAGVRGAVSHLRRRLKGV